MSTMRGQGMTRKAVIWLLAGTGLLLVAGAHVHLVYVATTSQPDCVAHLRHGKGEAQHGSFSAARSSCSP
jgi:hypothetical protein